MKATRTVISVSGPQGSGKSLVAYGMFLALGWRLIDADDFHDRQAREAMESAKGVDDEYRLKWIQQVFGAVIHEVRQGHNVILAWSGIRKKQREEFVRLFQSISIENVSIEVVIAWLLVPDDELLRRITERDAEGKHFATASLLPGQLAETEVPSEDEEDVIVVNGVCKTSATVEDAAFNVGERVWHALTGFHPYAR